MLLNKVEFLNKYPNIKSHIKTHKFNWHTLQSIYDDYVKQCEQLEDFMASRVAQLNKADGVHSTRCRLKHPEHLIEKIIRKGLASLTPRTYRKRIHDLIGVRVLHLYKDDWIQVDEFLRQKWTIQGQPEANIRVGDPDDYVSALKTRGFSIKKHRYGYRSLHYTIASTPDKDEILFEVQVRTIFEEAWSEIDHMMRYPYELDNPVISRYLVVFNRLAGSADEMGTFIRYLKTHQQGSAEEMRRKTLALKSKLKVSLAELARLRNRGGTLPGVSDASIHMIDSLNQRLTESDRLAEDIQVLQDAFLGGVETSQN